MESDNNIKDFFEKRLMDENPGADEWNIPSDDIWDNALPHFPKEKKKKRPFFFFLTGAGIFALVLVVGFYFSYETVSSSEVTTAKNEQLTDQIKNSKNLATDNNSAKITTQTINKTEEHQEINSSSIVSINDVDLKEKTRKNNLNETLNKNNIQESNFNNKIKTVVENLENAPKVVLDITKKTEKIILEISKKDIKKSLSNIQKETLALESESKVILATELATLPILNPEVIEKNKETDFNVASITPIKRKRQLKKWEIGLSHSPFIINWKNLLTADSLEAGEEMNFSINYQNINLPISRRLGKRWSLSSGIALSRIKACIDYSSKNFIYDANQSDPDWTASLREQTNSQFINTTTLEDLDINILPDVNLIDGDSLEMFGKIPVQFSFIQVPLVINYHFGKKRLEGLIHAGFYLNYLNESVKNVNFSLLKEDQLVAQSLNVDPYSEHYFEVTPIIGFGTKYHFSDQFNMGVSAKIELFAPPFSRFEIGAYYSF